MKKSSIALVLALMGAAVAPAQAQIKTGAVASNAYVTEGGLDWAWAFPLPASAGVFISAFQASQGWRLPTAAELGFSPQAIDFMYSGANVPLGGTDPNSGANFQVPNANLTGAAACATPWFSNSYTHCDWQDGLGQTFGPWAGMSGAEPFADQLVVRDAVVATPEPASIALLATGLVGIVGVARRRKA